MIHVVEQPEPPEFDAAVRQLGLKFLDENGIPRDQAPPAKTEFPPHWRKCLDDLHRLYDGTCAYLAIYFPRLLGASVDHFIAKSQHAGQAYEWRNFRLACSIMNSRKGVFDDVLDPFEVEDGWFRLELVSGRIYEAPTLDSANRSRVVDTIERLKLDDPNCRSVRACHFGEYTSGHCDADWLRRWSPFVWHEALRQGLLV